MSDTDSARYRAWSPVVEVKPWDHNPMHRRVRRMSAAEEGKARSSKGAVRCERVDGG